MRNFLTSFVGIFGVLFAISLPFSFIILPNCGNWITQLLSPISLSVAKLFTSVPSKELILSSDSSGLYGQTILILVLSLLGALIISKQSTARIRKIQAILFRINTYILALFLLKYGVDKLFLFQFYSPEPNTLATPIGQLTKDIAFWSVMGSSKSYNYFMAILEIVPAILLFFRRTRTFAAFISIGIMLNVFALNIGFDISVKLLSAYLVILSCYIFSKNADSYFSLFFQRTANHSKDQVTASASSEKLSKKMNGIHWGIVCILLMEIFSPYVQKMKFNGHSAQQTVFLRGSYVSQTPQESVLIGKNPIRNIHIHKDQYLIFEDTQGNFTSYSTRIYPGDSSIHFSDLNLTIQYSEKQDTSLFQWMEKGNLIQMTCLKNDLSALPLLQDDTHWTVEGMLE